jgi:molecular chaperone GrpE (heat shock protein)
MELANSHKELKRQRNDVEMLKAEFEALKKAMNEKIDGIQNEALNKLNELKQNFARNEAL